MGRHRLAGPLGEGVEQPFCRRPRAPRSPRGSRAYEPRVAVEVAAAGLDQAELVGHPSDRVDVFGVERAVVDLEAAQADRLQVAQRARCARPPRRSGPGPAARRRPGSRRSRRPARSLRGARRPAAPPEPAAEGLLDRSSRGHWRSSAGRRSAGRAPRSRSCPACRPLHRPTGLRGAGSRASCRSGSAGRGAGGPGPPRRPRRRVARRSRGCAARLPRTRAGRWSGS